MEKNKIHFMLSVGLLLMSSCSEFKKVEYEDIETNGKKYILKKTFDDNRNLLTEETLSKDSINDGVYKKWDAGKIQIAGAYDLGKKEGKWYQMDLGGDTIKVENWFSGKKFGSQFEYFSPIRAKGKPLLYKFSFFNIEGHEVSSIQFDVNQKVVKSSGLPLYCAYNTISLNKDSTFELMCFWNCPSNLNFRLFFEEVDDNGKIMQIREIVEGDKNVEVLDFAKKVSFEKRYLSEGNYRWNVRLSLMDSALNQIINDSSIIAISVR